MTPRKQFVVVTLAALATVMLTARLGVWQLDRAAQKTALQTSIDQRGKAPPVAAADLARDADDAAAQHHRHVTLRGTWRSAHTVFLDNRQMRGLPGFYVVTPLVLDDGRAVLVQRGWAPRHLGERERLPAVETPSGPVELRGRIAPPPARLYALGPDVGGPIRQNIDLESFARETGLALAPLSVQQVDGPDDGLLRQWPRPALDVHKNHGYAFQWFAMSALIAILYVWFQLIRPRRRRA